MTAMTTLEIKDLHVSVDGTEILKGVSLTVRTGDVIALMGPNGSGKSTLAYALMGHPKYAITKGSVLLDGRELKDATPTERAKAGLFLSFQYPAEVAGVPVAQFLRTAINARRTLAPSGAGAGAKPISVVEFQKLLTAQLAALHIDPKFAERSLNEGFSGGEKKRMEILQLAMLRPAIALLDETDSGLDVDSLRIVAQGINQLASQMGTLLITHYRRILEYIQPTQVHVLSRGKVIASGGSELVHQIEREGYDRLIKDAQARQGLAIVG